MNRRGFLQVLTGALGALAFWRKPVALEASLPPGGGLLASFDDGTIHPTYQSLQRTPSSRLVDELIQEHEQRVIDSYGLRITAVDQEKGTITVSGADPDPADYVFLGNQRPRKPDWGTTYLRKGLRAPLTTPSRPR